MRKFAVILLFVGSFVASSFALHCYNCDTKTDASCADDGYKENSMKCPESNSTDKFSAPTPVCLKEVTTENGIKSTVRSCTVESRQLVACSLVPSDDHCSTCKNDLCNGAERKIINYMMTFVSLFAMLSIKLF